MSKGCEVITSEVLASKKILCGKRAKYKVRHRDHPYSKSFYVCEDCSPAYKFKMDLAKGSFVVEVLNED